MNHAALLKNQALAHQKSGMHIKNQAGLLSINGVGYNCGLFYKKTMEILNKIDSNDDTELTVIKADDSFLYDVDYNRGRPIEPKRK